MSICCVGGREAEPLPEAGVDGNVGSEGFAVVPPVPNNLVSEPCAPPAAFVVLDGVVVVTVPNVGGVETIFWSAVT